MQLILAMLFCTIAYAKLKKKRCMHESQGSLEPELNSITVQQLAVTVRNLHGIQLQ